MILYIGLALLVFSVLAPFGFGIGYRDTSDVMLLLLLPTALGLAMCAIAYSIDRRVSSDPSRIHRLLLVPSILALLWGVWVCFGGYLGYVEISTQHLPGANQAELDMWSAQLAGLHIAIIDGILFLMTGLLLFFYARVSE